MLPLNRKALIVYVLVIIAALIFILLPDTASKEVNSIKSSKAVNIKEWKTKNGARVLYVYAPELPMVDIQTVFDAGSVRDGNKQGIAKLTNSLLKVLIGCFLAKPFGSSKYSLYSFSYSE